jgi:tyrosine ammonia-lyase
LESLELLAEAVAGARPETHSTPARETAGAIIFDPRQPLSIESAWDLSEGSHEAALSTAGKQRLAQGREFLDRLIRDRRRVYGVTTGYGPLACHHVDPSAAPVLQRNLIYHLASGVGAPFSRAETRAILTARLASLSRGHSGIRPASFEYLLHCLNANIIPVVPSQGTVGASGDLTPLAHIALAYLGEGEIWAGEERAPAAGVLRAHGLPPLDLAAKEGLALVNGTAAMTGIAVRNAERSRRAVELSLRLNLLYAELLNGKREAYTLPIARLRPHPGQLWAARVLDRLAESSARLEPVNDHATIAEAAPGGVAPDQPILQDAYSIRCAPQILGAVRDVIDQHAAVTEIELNAVTDNPLLFPEEDMVRHGGNFHGMPLALASDSLHNAIVTLAVLSERRTARLCDPLLNQGLPAFLQPDRTGLQSGFMGAQVTASALVAEMRSLSVPASIQSIPTNNNNQDFVPMGTIAARKASAALESLYHVLSIEAMALTQAMELRLAADDSPFSDSSHALAAFVRESAATLTADRPLSRDIERLSSRLASRRWLSTDPVS